MRRWLTASLLLAAASLQPMKAHAAGTLRFGLDFDFEFFDPARSGSYIERVVNTAMCDQLLDIDPQLNLVPQLATSWDWSADKLALTLHLRPGVVFSDGAPLDAEAVRANIERYRTAPYSFRRTELKSLTGVDVVDPLTIRIRLSEPFAPLLALLANRPGVMLSPRILGLSSDEIGAHPVCAGPFMLVERVAQDHITLKRSPTYWDAAHVQLDGVEFKIMTDSTVRLVNLQSGQMDVANRLAATDVPAVQADKRLKLVSSPSIGFEMLSFNLAHGAAADTPFGAGRARATGVREGHRPHQPKPGRVRRSNDPQQPDRDAERQILGPGLPDTRSRPGRRQGAAGPSRGATSQTGPERDEQPDGRSSGRGDPSHGGRGWLRCVGRERRVRVADAGGDAR